MSRIRGDGDEVSEDDAAFLAPYCGRSITVWVDTIGFEHPEFLVDLNFLSSVLEGLGFLELEKRSFKECVEWSGWVGG